ncbi:anti-sigma factor [Paenibacillus sp. NFR01]|uniref:anti-sigma factor family protein n=1 Tax=Paenibacillus sp. NFR01 TaxID=1566279 RepID=UPI0008B2B630|nr:zf-HC2 domain-containing protein [Paenibacillus sp. NFR01]SET67003.1 Putative zinc-finger [Paenibacillus sp. NFR01]
MNCTEVMEWMQRDMDHDLSPDEKIEMFRHLDDCASCAELYDQLTMLSSELEQLPEVKPPFSLVDSILPKLDELDRLAGKPGDGGEPAPNVVPMTRANTKKPTKGSWASTVAGRTGIGAAAAAVILFFAFLNMPDKIPNADMDVAMFSSQDNNAANDAATADSGAAPAQESSAADTGAADSGPEMRFSTAATDPAATADAGAADSAQTPLAAAVTPDPATSEGPKAPMMSKKAAADVPAASAAATATAGAGGNAAANAGGNEAQDYAADTRSSGDSDMAAASEAATMQAPATDTPGVMGILPTLTQQHPSLWTTPDGRHAAGLIGQQLVIYSLESKTTEDGRKAMTSLPFKGTWVSGEWSADSRQFTYVTDQDGTQVTEVYTLPADASLAPSPTP